jgi:hypothetical protein
MIAIEHTLVSDDILKEAFVCDLNKCKGACCVAGDAGAPLREDELPILEAIFEKVKPFLSAAGIKAIEEQGTYVKDEDDEYVTPLINGAECAYTVFENGIAACGIEKAHKAGVIDYKKPISCHLYPIRISEHEGFDAVNYHKWSVCSDACALGKSLKVPVYQFLKDPIIRKYGVDYYEQLQAAANYLG